MLAARDVPEGHLTAVAEATCRLKLGVLEIKTYEKSLNWLMRVKLIYRFSFRSERGREVNDGPPS